jgi:hypothetical protein
LKNNTDEQKKLLIFLDNGAKPLVFNFDENVKIKPIIKGKKGGTWYLGGDSSKKTEGENTLATGKYEYLPHDGILLFREKSAKSVVFLLNLEENIMTFFEQPD